MPWVQGENVLTGAEGQATGWGQCREEKQGTDAWKANVIHLRHTGSYLPGFVTEG